MPAGQALMRRNTSARGRNANSSALERLVKAVLSRSTLPIGVGGAEPMIVARKFESAAV